MFEENDDKRTKLVGMAVDNSSHQSQSDELVPFRRYLQPGSPGCMGQLSHFQIIRVIGRGGFGTVVLARDLKLDRLVAIKMLDPRLAVTSAPRKYFLREARCAAKLSHPNVVQIFAVEDSPTPYMVMEYIEGETLQDKLDREGPLDICSGIEIGQQIAAGLDAAHQYDLIHRDIKPANILIEKGTQRIKITDFGVARTVDDASLTQSGAVVGTPMYMSPEQANGDPVDHRSDLFSLGSVLYTLFSGRPPFRASTQLAILKRVAEDRPRCIGEVNPDLPTFIVRLVERLHEKDPQNRFQTANDVLDALKSLQLTSRTKFALSSKASLWYLIPCCIIIVLLSIVIAFQVGDVQPALSAQIVETPKQDESPDPNDFPDKISDTGNVKPFPALQEHDTYWKREFQAWKSRVHKYHVWDQIECVYKRLEDFNPGMHPKSPAHMKIVTKGTGRFAKVVEVHIRSSKLYDASPLQGFPELERLTIEPSKDDFCGFTNLDSFRGLNVKHLAIWASRVHDLSPLQEIPLEVLILQGGNVDDLQPIQQMKNLKQLTLHGQKLQSLEQLRGMPLEFLSLWSSPVTSLEPLRGMPLTYLNLGETQISDVSPLEGMKLDFLCLNCSKVEDLNALKGMPLRDLMIQRTNIKDISVIRGMPLKSLACDRSMVKDFSPATDSPIEILFADLELPRDREFLSAMKNKLRSINDKSAEQFYSENNIQ
ncbi:MAG: protein kinase [Zavarzinella sp.]